MPRYFFHLDYSLDTTLDPEGSDCADLDAARIEAAAIIQELAAECLTQDYLFEPIGISICDASGECLTKVSAAEAINEIIPLDDLQAPPSPSQT